MSGCATRGGQQETATERDQQPELDIAGLPPGVGAVQPHPYGSQASGFRKRVYEGSVYRGFRAAWSNTGPQEFQGAGAQNWAQCGDSGGGRFGMMFI